ncbi:MAG: hypothetical protein DDT18_00391 [Actinobacteria bacterium]|nr:hypothetical protein [Actinomycetota bacterium]
MLGKSPCDNLGYSDNLSVPHLLQTFGHIDNNHTRLQKRPQHFHDTFYAPRGNAQEDDFPFLHRVSQLIQSKELEVGREGQAQARMSAGLSDRSHHFLVVLRAPQVNLMPIISQRNGEGTSHYSSSNNHYFCH